jgi:hypothetical protein
MAKNDIGISDDDEDVPVVQLPPEEQADLVRNLTEGVFGIVNTQTGKMSSGPVKEEFKKLSPKRQRMLERAMQGLPANEQLEPGE